MASRTYDRTLDCGCMISSDGGGGLMPCTYDNEDIEQNKKCSKAWEEWEKTDDFKKHCQEVQERNE